MGTYTHPLLRIAGLILLLLVLPLSSVLARQDEPSSPVAIADLAPDATHRKLDQAITRLLSHHHYRRAKLDDRQSQAILDAYLESLDFNRSYFLASDVAGFTRKYRYTLDNHLQAGNLQPAYEIYNVFQRRLQERIDYALQQLRKPVDFSIDESVRVDREDLPWPRSRTELDEIWRKRLKNELLTLVLAGQDLAEARATLSKRYEGSLRRAAQANNEDVFQTYMNAVSRSFDPHTAYFSPRTSENFNIQMSLSLEGIGSVLRMEDERVKVVELVPGGPADLSGQLRPDDNIIGVGQGDTGQMMDVIGWRLDDVVDLIRGPRGTVVRLQVVPGSAGASAVGKTVRLVRDTIKLEKQAAKAEVTSTPGRGHDYKIGVITIPTFYSDFAAAQRGDTDYRSTTRDVRNLLEELAWQHVDGILIDLRQNGGGSLQEAVELTGLFIAEGPVVQVRNSLGSVEVATDPDPELVYDGPLAILVDRFSASASEIFAGALQDYGRALVIGEQTFGKGTVQQLIDLERFIPSASGDVGQLKLTFAKFYRINGSSTQHRGVIPDISFPATYDSHEVGESSQEHALPWDRIKPVDYESNRRLSAITPILARRHRERIATDRGFQYLVEEIEEAKKLREETTVSLVKSKREAEHEKTEARQRERMNQRRIIQGLRPLRDGEEIADDEDQPDPFLDEASRIVADLVDLLGSRTRDSGRIVMTGR